MIKREPAQSSLPIPGQAHANLPPVAPLPTALDQTALGQPVDQSHHTVMPELKTLGELTDRRGAVIGLHGQDQRVRRSFEPPPPRGLLTKSKKPANLVPKLSQRAEI